MFAENEVNFYLVMRNKYKKENVDVIDSVWGKASAKLSNQGLTVYTDVGQEIISAEYQNHFKY
ncbi:hypothetical protein [Methylotenera sp.]|uniref:hypothetical protein n=1 Tax=Methylotenera sp. TaxID=2051956 RepID=UPI002EDABC6B